MGLDGKVISTICAIANLRDHAEYFSVDQIPARCRNPVCERVTQSLNQENSVSDSIRMELLAGARDEVYLEQLRRLLSRFKHV